MSYDAQLCITDDKAIYVNIAETIRRKFLPEGRSPARKEAKSGGELRAEYVKKANRPKGRDAKLWGLKPRGQGSPVASISLL